MSTEKRDLRNLLPPEGKQELDEIMRELDARLATIPPIPPGILSCKLGNIPYLEIERDFAPKIIALRKKYHVELKKENIK